MRRAVLLLLAAAAWVTPARGEEPTLSACAVNCHTKEAKAFRDSVHATHIGCVDCHGGDATAYGDEDAAHAESAGFRGKLSREAIPEDCGSCHTDPVKMLPHALPADQLVHYRLSGHGRALFERGDTSVAVCTDCHGVHRVYRARDARSPSAPRNLPQTCGRCHAPEAEAFRTGIHGRALLVDQSRGAPSCADCHGAHGTAPPGVEAIIEVCGRCHLETWKHYRTSPHFGAAAFARQGCVTCHDSHGIAESGAWMYEGDEAGRCGACHEDEAGVDHFVDVIRTGRARMQERMAETRDELRRAKERGIYLEAESVYLRESERALISLRPRTHSLDAEDVEDHFADGIERQQQAWDSIRLMTRALRDRKILLAGLALLLVLLGSLLVVKLHAIRRLS